MVQRWHLHSHRGGSKTQVRLLLEHLSRRARHGGHLAFNFDKDHRVPEPAIYFVS